MGVHHVLRMIRVPATLSHAQSIAPDLGQAMGHVQRLAVLEHIHVLSPSQQILPEVAPLALPTKRKLVTQHLVLHRQRAGQQWDTHHKMLVWHLVAEHVQPRRTQRLKTKPVGKSLAATAHQVEIT